MRRMSVIGALLLVCVGVVLGTTIFRDDIAQATGLAQSVTIANTPSNPVPVQQQGTADVNVTNSSLAVRDQVTTQLVATGNVGSSNASLPDMDVSGYKQVRVGISVVACLPPNAAGILTIGSKEAGQEYNLAFWNICGGALQGGTPIPGQGAVFDVPGRTLSIHCISCTDVSVGLAVFGRSN
jgi:hypothetical protein